MLVGLLVGLRGQSQIAQLTVFPADLSPWAQLAKLNVVTVTTCFVSSLSALLLHFCSGYVAYTATY